MHPLDLSVAQQVGLLFVVLFGVLAAASVYVFWRSLRIADEAGRLGHERLARDLRAFWVGSVLFWIAWAAGPFVSTLLFGFVSFLALREYVTLTETRRGDHRGLLLAFFVVLPVQFALVGLSLFNAFTVFIPVYVFFAIPVISALANDPKRFLERNAKIQWGVTVCVYGISHAPALLLLDLPNWRERGAFLVFWLVVVVASAQFAEASAARRIRARPVARAISRSFTWKAFGVGALVGALVGTLLWWTTPWKPWSAFAMGAVTASAGMLGSLVVKALKRDAGVVRWGRQSSLTGAVGLLDRVAPLCFAAPVFFHSVRWYFGI